MPTRAELIVALARAYALTEIIPVHHSTIREALRALGGVLESLESDGVEATVSSEGLVVDGEPVRDERGLSGELARDLRALGVEALEVSRGADLPDLEHFVQALRETITGDRQDLADGLEAGGDGGLRLVFKDGRGIRFAGRGDELSASPDFHDPLLDPGLGMARSIDRLFRELRADSSSVGPEPGGAPAHPDSGGAPALPESAPAVVEDPWEAGGPEARLAVEVPADPPDETAETPDPAAVTGGPGTARVEESGAERDEDLAVEREEEPEAEVAVGEEDGIHLVESFQEGPLAPLAQEFLEAPSRERDDLRDRLLETASQEVEAGHVDPVVNALQVLARAGAEEHDIGALELARELATPAVASRFVVRVGGIWEETDRAELFQQASLLPDVMAPALADALAEARDRRARRAYMDAMKVMGEAGFRELERMVEDPRWYVVRNAVGVLGELGEEDVLAHLTSALAHQDPRVRRETVQALARIGGDDAGMLLVGMLQDPDPEVRAQTARAVGVVKAKKALRPLLDLLEEEREDEVVEQILRSLGRLGDPGAVPALQKLASGGFFSRTSRSVRIAAYRALADIGTPLARKHLEGAANDRDARVREAVAELLD